MIPGVGIVTGPAAFAGGSYLAHMGIEKLENYLAGKSDGFAQMLREHDESPVLQEVGRTIPVVVMAGKSAKGYRQLAKKGWRPVAGRAAASATGMAGTNALMTGLMERRMPTGKETLAAAASGATYGGGIGKEKDRLDFTKKQPAPEEKTYNELELSNKEKDNKQYEDRIRTGSETIPVRNQRGVPTTNHQSVEREQRSNPETDRPSDSKNDGRGVIGSQKRDDAGADDFLWTKSSAEYTRSQLDKAINGIQQEITRTGVGLDKNSTYHRDFSYDPKSKTIQINPLLLAKTLEMHRIFGVDPQPPLKGIFTEEITHHEIDQEYLQKKLNPAVEYLKTFANLSPPQRTALEEVYPIPDMEVTPSGKVIYRSFMDKSRM